jgi:hypothetical protein
MKITLMISILLFIFFASIALADPNYNDENLIEKLIKLLVSLFGQLLEPEHIIKLANVKDRIRQEYGIDLNPEHFKKNIEEFNQIKKESNGLWTPGFNIFFFLPKEERAKLLGGKIGKKRFLNEYLHGKIEDFDETNFNKSKNNKKKRNVMFCDSNSATYLTEFDARNKWNECKGIIDHIQNQGRCGFCWAVSSASAYTDRYCIERLKKGIRTPSNDAHYQFSALDILSCSNGGNCEDGGFPYTAWRYIQNKGICTGTDYKWKSGCKPYPFRPNGRGGNQRCRSSCTTEWNTTYTKDKHFGIKFLK